MTAGPGPGPSTGDQPGSNGWAAGLGERWDNRRWHYRRSLASRVGLLTTMAVGLAIAFMALGTYLTVNMQMQRTLDESLDARAEGAAEGGAITQYAGKVPSSVLGAADVRMSVVYASGVVEYTRDPDRPDLDLGGPELQVARDESKDSLRTIRDDAGGRRRVVAVPAGDGRALVLAQSLEPQEKVLSRLGLVMLFFGGMGVLAAGLAGWAVALNGLRPVRRLTRATEEIARIFSRKHSSDDESVRKQCWHVLAAVNGEVDVACEQRILDFLHEQPLASDLRQRRLAEAITRRFDDDDLAERSRAIAKECGHGVGLIKSERAATGADPECRIHVSLKGWRVRLNRTLRRKSGSLCGPES